VITYDSWPCSPDRSWGVSSGNTFFGIVKIMGWAVETLDETVEKEVGALPEDMRARLARIAKLIEEKGLERVGDPHVKHLEGRLWEMRLKGRSGISRALYVTASGWRVVIVRVFVKKTQKTPRSEISLALSRAKSIQ
jgi:phage-related protein